MELHKSMGKFKNLVVIAPSKDNITPRLEKRCSTCGKHKLLEKFNLRKDRPDGRSYQCRKCKNDADKERYRLNPKPSIEASLKWNKEHPDRFLKSLSKYQNRPEIAKKIKARQPLYQAKYRNKMKLKKLGATK